MKKTLVIALALAMAAMGASTASARGIPFKMKAKKVLGDLVPAFACAQAEYGGDDFTLIGGAGRTCTQSLQVKVCSTTVTTNCAVDGDCPGGETCVGNVYQSAVSGNNCEFDKGKFKILVGKDAQAQVLKLTCAGPIPASLCSHIGSYSTIVDQNIDSKGNVDRTETCDVGGNEIAGQSTFALSQVGFLDCDTEGKMCKGTLPATTDPCPTADKVSQFTRFEVFDGPDSIAFDVGGKMLEGCCGINQQIAAGGFPTKALCDTFKPGWNQDVLAVPGIIVQVK